MTNKKRSNVQTQDFWRIATSLAIAIAVAFGLTYYEEKYLFIERLTQTAVPIETQAPAVAEPETATSPEAQEEIPAEDPEQQEQSE